MKDFKPLMKIGNHNSLEILINNMKIAGIDDIYVVVGYNADIISEFLADKEVNIVFNEHFENGMFTSIKKGIEALQADHDCALMTPVDIPLIPPYIMEATLERFYKSPDHFVVPCFEGKKGHPLCIPAMYMAEVLESEGENGLKSVTSKHEDKFIKFDTHCESIIMDMDTPDAYKMLVDYYEAHRYPDEAQCRKILKRMETPSHVIRHCMAVTETAVFIAEELNKHGGHYSVPLLRASGMLHDVLRTRKKHWEEGAKLASNYGYPEVADIIMDHMNYVHPLPVFEITEKDIICLSDKLRQEDKLVTLKDRLEPVRAKWAHDPDALQIIEDKINASAAVMKYIEEVIGEDLFELLKKNDERKALENPEAAKKPQRLILIRHGETQRHKEKIFLGQTDVPLNVEGKEQCTHVGLELQHFDVNTRKIYASDLKRALESARIIARILGDEFEVIETPEFREMNLGAWDGMFISEVKEKYPEAYERRGSDLLNFRIDDEAESFQDLSDRVVPKVKELIAGTDEDIIIVGHSGVMRVIKCMMNGRPLSDIAKMKFARGTYEIIEIEK